MTIQELYKAKRILAIKLLKQRQQGSVDLTLQRKYDDTVIKIYKIENPSSIG